MPDSKTIGHTTLVQITLHARWTTAGSSALDADAWSRLPAYVTRYAQTIGVVVYAVGGASDHLHLLFDLPMDRSLDAVTGELQGAIARFMRSVLGQRGFAWVTDGVTQSIGAADRVTMCAYVSDNAARHAAGMVIPLYEDGGMATENGEGAENSNDEGDALPAWLRGVLPTLEERA